MTAGYGYDVFGAIRTQSGASANVWLVTGEQRDSDSSLYYLRARYFDPETGRFLGRDPLPLLNRYTYVRNSPLNYIDPYGLIDLTPDFVDDAIDKGGEFVNDAYDEGKKFVTETVPSISGDVWNVLRRFGTLNCLSFGISVGAVIASFLAPELSPGIALSLSLWWAGANIGEKLAFTSTTIINALSFDKKEGFSTGNILSTAGTIASFGAVVSSTLAIASPGVNIPFVATATAISGYQCARDVF